MLAGFNKIVEERIKKAQKNGVFDGLPGSGEPLVFENDSLVPEDLRLAYKILKNADCVPPEIEIKNEINRLEMLMSATDGSVEKYRLLKKINLLIMKLNLARNTPIQYEFPQYYEERLVERLGPKEQMLSPLE